MLAALGRRARLAPALARHASVQASILNRDMGVSTPCDGARPTFCLLPVLFPVLRPTPGGHAHCSVRAPDPATPGG